MSKLKNNDPISAIQKSAEGAKAARFITAGSETEKKTVNFYLSMHDMEKSVAFAVNEAKRMGLDQKIIDGLERIEKLIDVAYKAFYKRDGSLISKGAEEMGLYEDHLATTLEPNPYFIFGENPFVVDKDILGNKGFQLCKMIKAGLPVPKTFILSSLAVEMIHKIQDIPYMEMLQMLLKYFGNNKIAVRSSGVVSMAGMMDSILNVDPNNTEELKQAILDVVNSWDSQRAKMYRSALRMDNDIQMAIVFQPMVDPVFNPERGLSGIAFSHDLATGEEKVNGEYLQGKLGEDIAQGAVTPQILPADLIEKYGLKGISEKLVNYYKSAVEFEFVVENDRLYIVQSREATLTNRVRVEVAHGLWQKHIIEKADAMAMIRDIGINDLVEYIHNPEIKHFVEAVGLVNGFVAGNAVFAEYDAEKAKKPYKYPILITDKNTPEDFPKIEACAGIIIKEGGYTSHPSVIARQKGIPCVRFDNMFIQEGGEAIGYDVAIIGDYGIKHGQPISILSTATGSYIYIGKADLEQSSNSSLKWVEIKE